MRIMEVDADKGTTRSLTSSTTPSFLPMWTDNEKRIVYLEVKDNMETATLCRLDLENKTTESLMSDVTFFCRVQITKDGKWAVATTVVPQEGLAQKPQPEKRSNAMLIPRDDTIRAARVNLQGKPVVEYLTSKEERALYGTLSPDGNRIAYCTGPDIGKYEKVVVKDLKTGTEKVIWQAEKK